MPPQVARTRAELAQRLADRPTDRPGNRPRDRPGDVVLVPTMGALHEGHASLLRAGRVRAGDGGVLVASVFVNPLQFAAGEDLERYPRTFEADLVLCGEAGVDVVFAPTVEEVYPVWPPAVTVDPGPLGSVLEGAVRPDHFRGVLTVVAKLFGLVAPTVAVFGDKDYQQLALIRQMVADLCWDIEVVGGETVREDDGLAMSSRNRYLSEAERAVACQLAVALRAGADAAAGGADSARAVAEDVLSRTPFEVDYVAVTGPDLRDPPPAGEGRILAAARLGTTRLIDNLPLRLGG